MEHAAVSTYRHHLSLSLSVYIHLNRTHVSINMYITLKLYAYIAQRTQLIHFFFPHAHRIAQSWMAEAEES